MPSYKITYFNGRGAAEISRLIFAAAGVDYVDERFTMDEFKAIKAGQPLKQLPVLDVDGKKFCQGAAIARYLAREFGLMGKDNCEAFRIDELYEAIVDITREIFKIYFEKDECKKGEMKKTLAEETLPKFMDFFEKKLCENCDGKGFFVGKELTLGDLIVFNGLSTLRKFLGDCACGHTCEKCEKHPKLKALCERVATTPKIAEWLKKRPESEF